MQASQTLFQSARIGSIDVQNAQKEGTLEAIKELVKERAKNYQKLNALLAKSQSIPLYRLSTFWPFKLFPVHIEIANDRISINFWEFIKTGQYISLSKESIEEVSLASGPIFSTLKIRTTRASDPCVQISYLRKEEAFKATRLIQGIITATKNDISLENIDSDDLAEKLEGLGSAKKIERLIV